MATDAQLEKWQKTLATRDDAARDLLEDEGELSEAEIAEQDRQRKALEAKVSKALADRDSPGTSE